MVVAHLAVLFVCVLWSRHHPGMAGAVVGYVVLMTGIVEGAALLGWRLTQLPKSQALEFLLVTPLRGPRVLLGEAAVGFGLLALVTLSGLPVLVLLWVCGYVEEVDLGLLLATPLTWGAITGLGFTAWAYEPARLRRWGERILLVLTLVYLVVGVLAGEHLRQWLDELPGTSGSVILFGLEASHRYNPFAIVQFWFQEGGRVAYERALAVEVLALGCVTLLLARATGRLHGHFHELHYRPVMLDRQHGRGSPGDQPLSWWAVRRVTRYAGRVNLWLAGGFSMLYGLYVLAGPRWPAWLGSSVFALFDQAGGVPVWATALVVLGAVPAAFQYGIWDHSAQDRHRRLELLLLTELTGLDYWKASGAAAWRRGRGYCAVAVLLFAAATLAGRLMVLQALAATATAVLLWGLYFALGFRAFSRGVEAKRLGLGLTLGLPILTLVFSYLGWPLAAALLPPGGVCYAAARSLTLGWFAGTFLCGVTALIVSRKARQDCAEELRHWCETHRA
jgi:hypothetical protein